jgi:hypothetical protein
MYRIALVRLLVHALMTGSRCLRLSPPPTRGRDRSDLRCAYRRTPLGEINQQPPTLFARSRSRSGGDARYAGGTGTVFVPFPKNSMMWGRANRVEAF